MLLFCKSKGHKIMKKILHIADLHLDSPFSAFDPLTAEAKREGLRRTFRSAVKYARENDFSLLLISGDLYDGGFITRETARMLCDELSSLAIPVVIAPGNHDPYVKFSLYESRALPKNVFVFTEDKLDFFDFDELNIRVYGYAFCDKHLRQSPLSGADVEPSGKINILCAHGDTESPLSPYAPLSFAEISRLGFTYAALGHIHNPPPPQKENGCVTAYSGFFDGRGFDELGYGSALAVTLLDDGGVDIEKLSFSTEKYEEVTLDAIGIENDTELCDKISGLIGSGGYDERVSLRIALRGNLPPDYIPDIPRLEETLGQNLALLQIKDETTPLLSDTELKYDKTMRGELYRRLLPKLTSADPVEKETSLLALKIALAALEGGEISSVINPKYNESEASPEWL